MRVIVLCGFAAWAAGCADDRVAVYEAPKDAPAAAPHVHDHAAPAPSRAEPEGGLAWTAPEAWRAKAPSAMRLASFEIPAGSGRPVDLSVVALPGAAGGALANVNRWREQVGLPPLAADALDRHVETVTSPAGRMRVVLFEGRGEDGPAAILGGLLDHGGQAWFFKATGTPEAVRAARPSVLAFLKGVHVAH